MDYTVSQKLALERMRFELSQLCAIMHNLELESVDSVDQYTLFRLLKTIDQDLEMIETFMCEAVCNDIIKKNAA